MKRILILFLILNLTPGCLILPLPAGHRDEIDKVQSQIAVGRTTREEVISILEEPDFTTDRFILYRHKKYDGGAVVMFLFGGATAGEVFMDLYFEFDNYGVLVDFRTDKYDRSFRSVKDDEDTSKMEEACDPGMESCP